MNFASYEGLAWQEVTENTKTHGVLVAHSQTTPLSYRILMSADKNGWYTECVFYDREKRQIPSQKLGDYLSLEVAILAAERHDWIWIQSLSEEPVIFMGSDKCRELALSMNDDDDINSLMDAALGLGGPAMPNGIPFNKAASFVHASKSALKQEKNGDYTITFRFNAKEMPIHLMQSPQGADYMLGMVMLNDSPESEKDEWSERHQRAVKRAAIIAEDNTFQEWIGARYDIDGLIETAKHNGDYADLVIAVDETVKRITGVPSKRDYLFNRRAVEKLERIDQEFYFDLSRRNEIYSARASK